MTPAFVDLIKTMFGEQEIKVVVEGIKQDAMSAQDQHQSLTALRELFKDAKVDPNIDISKLADEVNL